MPRRKKTNADQASFLENYGRTAPAVPAIRAAVNEWRDRDYPGVTATTRALLNYWFRTDHVLRGQRRFKYHMAQREAVETLIYTFEIAQTRSLTSLYEAFIPAEYQQSIRPPSIDPFARYCVKMATGSGKTKVMALAIAWQFLNAIYEGDPAYATTFLIIAPNVIVYERLSSDFFGGRIFKDDPIVPKTMKLEWMEMQCYTRGESERGSSAGAVYITNVQQLYERAESDDEEPDALTAVLGSKPAANLNEAADFQQRMLARAGQIMVINDEAHHTHDPDNAWNGTIRALHERHDRGIALQLDLSATPRYASGALFAWTISDFTLRQAIIQRIVKRPIKGVTDIAEVSSNVPSKKYEPFLVAGVERWREYRDQLAPLKKKPLLFIMMNDTDEADSIGAWLQTKFPDDFGADRTLVIHTKRDGEIVKGDLDKARQAARDVDRDDSPINAIVSVLMLREGWDVQNVTVIVGLRPFNAKANILPEQTIGRGLRLMFRDIETPYVERVDIIGNGGFINFIEELEQAEDIQFDTWAVGKETLQITHIQPEPERAEFDIAIPVLSAIFTREIEITAELEALDVLAFTIQPMPLREDSPEAKTFRYEGRDLLTLETLFEREYNIPVPQNAGEVVAYIAQLIAGDLKLPSQFAVIAPKVRDFLKYKAFGRTVELNDGAVLKAIATPLVAYVTKMEFVKALRPVLVKPREPQLEGNARLLSGIQPFAWSQDTVVCRKTIFNKVPCDNQLETAFARFADRAHDVVRFSKLPMQFGFTIPYSDVIGNLRHYYPDFVVVDQAGVHYVVETKGREDTDVVNKDRAATIWAENAARLTDQEWRFVKVMQRDFEKLETNHFADLAYLGHMTTLMFTE